MPAAVPELSVVLVTLNEADNLDDAVRSLLVQSEVSLEILVVDGGSTDGTADIARGLEAEHPDVVRLVASRPLPIGPARNLGIAEARAPLLAFMSADATAKPGWAHGIVDGLQHADVVYGRQEHAPPRLNVAAVVRGLRYHHFRDDTDAPAVSYASNVNAAVRREVFDSLRYVDEGPASALDDILFTHEAQDLGLKIGYRRDAVVCHKDATSLAEELVKNRREGFGWGLLSPTLGYHATIVAWAVMLFAGALLLIMEPHWWAVLIFVAVVWLPVARRVVRSGSRFARAAPLALLGAFVLSPLFDLVFLFDYLRGLRARRDDLTGRVVPQGAIP